MSTLRDHFERVWPWLAAAVDRYGETHGKEDVWEAIDSGRAQLWPLNRGAMVTAIDTHPTGYKELRGWLAGGDINEIIEWQPRIERWARDAGCKRAVIVGRRGWLKAFNGYREIATLMAKDL